MPVREFRSANYNSVDMKTLILCLLCCLSAFGASVTATWDLNPPSEAVINYSLWEQLGTNWTRLLTVATNSASLTNVTSGIHTYSVTASNACCESIRSSPVSTPFIPNSPTNVVLHLSAVLQTAPQPTGPWSDFAMVDLPDIAANGTSGFYRVKLSIK